MYNTTIDWMELGPTPVEENCAQCGTDDFDQQNKIETWVYKRQLERQFPDANFRVKAFPHEFGSYREVCVALMETDSEDDTPIAYEVESNLPMNWDEQAKAELKEKGYTVK